MTIASKLLTLLSCLALAGSALAQSGPAITTLKIGVDGGDQNDFHYWGQSGGIAAYSFGTTSCNPGTQTVLWTSSNHPVIGQNLFRLEGGRFEQLGQSWLKHGFCAVNESGCGSCQATSCSTLGIGCADTYWATLNDGAGGGPKWQVNATSGVHADPHSSPTGNSTIRGRLQVSASGIDPAQHPGAEYFAEAQYVSAHTAQNGNGGIANSWRKLNVVSISNIDGGGPTVVNQCAPYAWRAEDPAVTVLDFRNDDEGGAGVHGHFTLGYKVTDLGGGQFRYQYVIYNRTSNRSAGSFQVPLGNGVTLSNLYFHDVAYHSGEPFNGIDWVPSQGAGSFRWETAESWAQNANANALRWGTMYGFGFDADAPPVASSGEVGLFAPGAGSDVLVVALDTPGDGAPPTGTAFCHGDGSGTACPCGNHGSAGGCDNSNPGTAGCVLSGSGDASLAGDTVVLSVAGAIPSSPGLFFQGSAETNNGNGAVYGDGLRCCDPALLRIEVAFADGGGACATSVPLSTVPGDHLMPGDARVYQYWYRDPVAGPCGARFNLSNGYRITWN